MKILIAPNSFKECATASKIADIIADKFIDRSFVNIEIFPVSDGGDSFLDVYDQNFSTTPRFIPGTYCFNKQLRAIPLSYDNEKSAYILESAEIIGLKTIPEEFRNPKKLNSQNLGYLFSHLIDQLKANKIIIGLGGTGTTDLGLGLCVPFGLQLYDSEGNQLEVIPENYIKTGKIVLPEKTKLQIEAITDVEVPVYGVKGAAYIFAPQKGASAEDIPLLDDGFKNIVNLIEKQYGIHLDVDKLGAAGGLCVGLSLIGNLQITTSNEFLKGSLKLDDHIEDNDLILTAEGRFDEQSLLNKASGIIVEKAIKQNRIVVIITGECTVDFNNYRNSPIIFELVKLLGSKKRAIEEYKAGIELAIDQLCNMLHLGPPK